VISFLTSYSPTGKWGEEEKTNNERTESWVMPAHSQEKTNEKLERKDQQGSTPAPSKHKENPPPLSKTAAIDQRHVDPTKAIRKASMESALTDSYRSVARGGREKTKQKSTTVFTRTTKNPPTEAKGNGKRGHF